MNTHAFVRNNAATYFDSDGRRLFFVKSPIETTKYNGKKGVITAYNLLRYEAGECCKSKWKGDANNKLKEVAQKHKQLIEDGFNGKYTFNEGGVSWKVDIKVIIITEDSYSLEEFQRNTSGFKLNDDNYLREQARYRVYRAGSPRSLAGGAFSSVVVSCNRKDQYSLGEVPADDPGIVPEDSDSTTPISLQNLLLHELVGHHMNNKDETVDRGWPDVDPDSIMSYHNKANKFYNYHFTAGFSDMDIHGNPISGNDNTSLLDASDGWFNANPHWLGSNDYTLDVIKTILGE